jgi:tetratricopeptide (TPR) repeat protein
MSFRWEEELTWRTCRLDLFDDSIKYATQGLEMPSSDKSALPFYLWRSLSMSHAAMGHHEEAVQEVDRAIEALPQDWKDDEELTDVVEWIYKQKGDYLNALERPEDAIEAYKYWKGVKPQTTVDGYFLDDMTRICRYQESPKFHFSSLFREQYLQKHILRSTSPKHSTRSSY